MHPQIGSDTLVCGLNSKEQSLPHLQRYVHHASVSIAEKGRN